MRLKRESVTGAANDCEARVVCARLRGLALDARAVLGAVLEAVMAHARRKKLAAVPYVGRLMARETAALSESFAEQAVDR